MESENEVSFGLTPLNGQLSPSDPKTPEPFSSPFRAQNPERGSYSNPPQNLGSGGQNLGSVVKLKFSFDFRGGEIKKLTCD